VCEARSEDDENWKGTNVMNEAQPQNAGVDVSADWVIPDKPRDGCWNDEGHEGNEPDIPLMLPPDDVVVDQV